jgi:hypothetical protein
LTICGADPPDDAASLDHEGSGLAALTAVASLVGLLLVGQLRRGEAAETALRAGEPALGGEREHLAHAQRVAEIGSFEVDFRTGLLGWSDEMYRIFGLPRDSMQSPQAFL